MLLQSLAQPLAYLGAALGIAMVVPQLTRTIRHPNLPGVSALSWGLLSLGCLMWLTYGIRTSAMSQIPGNVVLIAGAVAVVLLVPGSRPRSARALLLVAAAGILLVTTHFLPAQTVGFVAFGFSLVSSWPQLVASYGNWRCGIVSGLSLTTFFARMASISCWLSYALISTDTPVAVSSTFGLAATVAIISMEMSLRVRGSAALAEGRNRDLQFEPA
jgi:uncharacterized protein with PQ loop repeat